MPDEHPLASYNILALADEQADALYKEQQRKYAEREAILRKRLETVEQTVSTEPALSEEEIATAVREVEDAG